MQSIFDLKTELPFDMAVFASMKKRAEALLQNTEHEQYTQAVVLLSDTQKEYSAIIKNALSKERTDERSLLEGLKSAGDTGISYILCMWQDGSIDIPSLKFRKMLFDLNEQNARSLIFVMTKNGISGAKLENTIK